MGIANKLPPILSFLALINSAAMPFLLKKERPKIIKPPEEPINTTKVVKIMPPRKKMPGIVSDRFKEMMSYLDCLDKEKEKKKDATEEEIKKMEETCRGKHWYWY